MTANSKRAKTKPRKTHPIDRASWEAEVRALQADAAKYGIQLIPVLPPTGQWTRNGKAKKSKFPPIIKESSAEQRKKMKSLLAWLKRPRKVATGNEGDGEELLQALAANRGMTLNEFMGRNGK